MKKVSGQWELYLCYRWLLKHCWSPVEAHPCPKIKRPCGSRASDGGARGWVSQLRLRNTNFVLYIPTTSRDNFTMSRVCNTIKYRRYARYFLIATLFIWKYFTRNVGPRTAAASVLLEKNDTARALPRPFPPRRKGRKKTIHIYTHESAQVIIFLFFSFSLNYAFSLHFSSSMRNFKTFHLRVESAGYSGKFPVRFSSRKPTGIVPYGVPPNRELEIDFFARN